MTLLSRSTICEKLGLDYRGSYRIIGPSRLGLFNSGDVVDLLNRRHRGISTGSPPLAFIPDDLRTPEEMADEIDGVTPHMLLCWTRRTKNIAPHFRLTKQITRFSARELLAWLDERSRVCRKRVA